MATLHEKRQYQNVLVGFGVRRSIGLDKTYRVRRGNGHYGSIAGEIYQDKYTYFVPGSINNPESAGWRTLFKEAVEYWKNTLTDEEKNSYNRRAHHGLQMSGYNLFIREYMKRGIDVEIPSGLIALWGGLIASIPAGWSLCDGADGRPDLRHKFVRGAGTGQDPGDTGGSETHTHLVSGTSEVKAINHGHSVNIQSRQDTVATAFVQCGSDHEVNCCDHSHLVAGATGNCDPSHDHSISFTSAACSTLPSYYELAYIQKD